MKKDNKPAMEWTYSTMASLSFPIPDYIAEMWKKERELKEADRSVFHARLKHAYQKAIAVGMKNVFEDIEELVGLINKNHLDKKYRGAIEFRIEQLKHIRKHEFLEKHYNKIDRRMKELGLLLALMDAYWYNNDIEIPKHIFSMHNYLSTKIRTNYAKRNKAQEYFDKTIEACEEQIAMAKNIAKKVKKGVRRYTLKSTEEIIVYFNNWPVSKQKELPADFNPAIHKSPDDLVLIPGKLGEHTGYKQLCIIRESQGNFVEVIRLAEQAKSEGWAGDWDKRIERAKKKLGRAQ